MKNFHSFGNGLNLAKGKSADFKTTLAANGARKTALQAVFVGVKLQSRFAQKFHLY